MKVRRIGAWAARSGLRSPAKALKVALNAGLTDVSFCVHPQGTKFEPFVSVAKCAKALALFVDAGVTPHLMVWPVPDVKHSQKVIQYVNAVKAAEPGLKSVDCDVEEQYTKHPLRAKLGPQVATLYKEGLTSGLGFGINAITAALQDGVLDEWVAVAEFAIPQAYTTTRAGQHNMPGARQDKVEAIWRARLRPDQSLYMGLAAYDQDGVKGLPALKAMKLAFDAVKDDVDEVRYWLLDSFAQGYAKKFIIGQTAALKCS